MKADCITEEEMFEGNAFGRLGQHEIVLTERRPAMLNSAAAVLIQRHVICSYDAFQPPVTTVGT